MIDPRIKSARAAITKVKALTVKIVSSSEYWNTSAGRSLHYSAQDQGEQGLKRKKGRLRGLLRKLDTLSNNLDADTRSEIRLLRSCTESVLFYCEHFPRHCEWPGLQYVRRQKLIIACLRQRLKGRPA
jgi:hypothetical protein